MAIIPSGGNGQWVRARTEEGARSLLDERQAEADRRAEEYQRSLLLRRKLRARVRALFHHG